MRIDQYIDERSVEVLKSMAEDHVRIVRCHAFIHDVHHLSLLQNPLRLHNDTYLWEVRQPHTLAWWGAGFGY